MRAADVLPCGARLGGIYREGAEVLILAGLEIRGGGVDTGVDESVLSALQVRDSEGGDGVLVGAEVDFAGGGEIGRRGGVENGLTYQLEPDAVGGVCGKGWGKEEGSQGGGGSGRLHSQSCSQRRCVRHRLHLPPQAYSHRGGQSRKHTADTKA